MITLNKFGNIYNRLVCSITGLSTDIKPTNMIEGMFISNGSVFTEIDTGNIYCFDAENKIWYCENSVPQLINKRTLNILAKNNIVAGDTIYTIDQPSKFIDNEAGTGDLVHYSSITEDDKFIAICGGTTTANSFVRIYYINSDLSLTLVNSITDWDGIPYSVDFSHDEKHFLVTGTFTGKAKWYSFNMNTGSTTFITNLYADAETTALDGTIYIGIISHTDRYITLCGDFTGEAKFYQIINDEVNFLSDFYLDNNNTVLDAMSVVGQFNYDDSLICLGGWFTGKAKLYSIGINGTLTYLQDLKADVGTTVLSNYVDYAKFNSNGKYLAICGLFTGIAKLYKIENNVATYVADFKADSNDTALNGEAYYIDFAPNDNEVIICGKFTGKAKLYTIGGSYIVYLNDLQANSNGDAITNDCTSINFMTNKNYCYLTGYFNEDMKIYKLETWAYSANDGVVTIGSTGNIVQGARIGYATSDIVNENEGAITTISSVISVT